MQISYKYDTSSAELMSIETLKKLPLERQIRALLSIGNQI